MSDLAVFDCMLFLREVLRPQGTHAIFQLVNDGKLILCLSQDVVAEIRDVLARPKIRNKYPAVTDGIVNKFLSHYVALSRHYSPIPEVYNLERDPKDSKYINLAIAAKATYLVTTDNDLLELVDTSTDVGQDFTSRFPFLDVVDPRTLLAKMNAG